MVENNLLSIIIFAPLVGAVINWLVGGYLKNKPYSETFTGIVGCGSIAVSCVVAFYIAFVADGGALFIDKPILDQLWTWIQVGSFRTDFGLGMDHLSGIYACFVTFVGLLIHIFTMGYMHGDKGFYRFFAYLNLFMFSMLTLVLADNFLLMFVGWEGVGLCSYLLIGYYIKRDEAREAAKKAFVMNRIGDWGVLIGIFLIFTLTGTISFYDKTVDGTHVASALNIFAAMAKDPFTAGAIFAGGVTSVAFCCSCLRPVGTFGLGAATRATCRTGSPTHELLTRAPLSWRRRKGHRSGWPRPSGMPRRPERRDSPVGSTGTWRRTGPPASRRKRRASGRGRPIDRSAGREAVAGARRSPR